MRFAKVLTTAVLLCLCAVGFASQLQITPIAYKGTVKALDNGVWEIAFAEAPKDWVMVHLQLAGADKESNFVSFTLEQLQPAKLCSKRILVQFRSTARSAHFFSKDFRVDLRDKKPHRYSYSIPEGKKLGCISLVVDRPIEPVVLRIRDIKLEKRNIQSKRDNTPLPPVMFKGKPFFPIGAFDMTPNNSRLIFGEIDPDFLAAGGNMGFIGQIGLPEHPLYVRYFQPALFNALKIAASKPEFADVALLVSLSGISIDDSKFKTERYCQKVTGADLERRKKLLADALKVCAANPNVIGYYLDEPENVVFSYINKVKPEEWKKNKEKYLIHLMLDWHKWLYDAVRKHHPAAKMMITLGWWTTYEKAADMYDVNMPNEYNAELNPDRLFQTNYDAAMAVAAARKAGKGKTVVYMPGMFNVLAGTNAKPATIEAQRYCMFAPITRGVMGVFGWRLTRCTAEYRKTIVYPVMKEVSNFKDYFLGEWHDGAVTSDHDTASVDYLKKYQERNSLVIGKDDGDYLSTVDMVPDVSYCLRRNPATGKYLLLAVNNRREAIKVVFNVELEKLPASVKCAFDKTEAAVNGKKLTCEFKPFGVHAFEFELGK